MIKGCSLLISCSPLASVFPTVEDLSVLCNVLWEEVSFLEGFVRPEATASARPSLLAMAPQCWSFFSLERSEMTCRVWFFPSYALPTCSATTFFGATSVLQLCPAGWEHLQPDTTWDQHQFLTRVTCVWWLSAMLACAPHVHPSVVGSSLLHDLPHWCKPAYFMPPSLQSSCSSS